MRNPAELSVYRPLHVMLALMAFSPMVEGWFGMHSLVLAFALQCLTGLATSYASFVWFCRDSDNHRYRRSLLRNIGMIFVALLFIPYYLVRTRTGGKKWRALLKMVGFFLLTLLASGIGVFLASLLVS